MFFYSRLKYLPNASLLCYVLCRSLKIMVHVSSQSRQIVMTVATISLWTHQLEYSVAPPAPQRLTALTMIWRIKSTPLYKTQGWVRKMEKVNLPPRPGRRKWWICLAFCTGRRRHSWRGTQVERSWRKSRFIANSLSKEKDISIKATPPRTTANGSPLHVVNEKERKSETEKVSLTQNP